MTNSRSSRLLTLLPLLLLLPFAFSPARAEYRNFESSHVHPIALTPDGERLLAVNTPDALLEVFSVQPDGGLAWESAIPVGLEPVSVIPRSATEAWVVNNLSDSISIVDLDLGLTVKTLKPGDEPTDVVFAAGRAFVAVSQEDALKVYSLADLDVAPVAIPLAGRDVRAVAASGDGLRVYAVVLRSGNGTSVVGVNSISQSGLQLDPARLAAMNLRDLDCAPGPAPGYPPLPPGIARNPALIDPGPSADPPVGVIVEWDETNARWEDEAGQDWSDCLGFRPADHDLFVIDTATLAVTEVGGLGTTLFDVSVRPDPDPTPPLEELIYVTNTDARNFVRFEHPLGLQGHIVENRVSIVDPQNANAVTPVDLNTHIVRSSNPASNLAERQASVSQPGMLVWSADGAQGYMTAIGSRKLFRVDGACQAGNCIFGPNRGSPAAVEVGEGPTGVALAEGKDRLYVLNRISHSIAIVAAGSMTKLEEIPLHDPSPASIRDGRHFLYDAVDLSGHGDAACSSCHISGDIDGLAWDLGDPTGEMSPYATAEDNVRFVLPQAGQPLECPAGLCASHQGFDPQKGPMTTQSLRGMLEPLHWRGDRATMNDFNQAFVGLMGTADIGPIGGKPAGVSAPEMESFRQFALGIRYPPNPYRMTDDTLPCGPRSTDPNCEVQVHGSLFPGNPTEGAAIFDDPSRPSDGGEPCVACHTHPFGAAGGVLGGVTPQEPTSPDAAALFNGDADGSPHSDLKVPHLRNMYDKIGPIWADPGGPIPATPVGFGFTHDGSMPDMFRFFSAAVFTLSAADQAQVVRDIVSFMFHFPTETRPAVGVQVTVPAGAPPTGSAADEALLNQLIGLGDLAEAQRHCELVASTRSSGEVRRYRFEGAVWVSDRAADAPLSSAALRGAATDPVTFTCVPLGSGGRLGGDRDEDLVLDGDDCAPADSQVWASPEPLVNLRLQDPTMTQVDWQPDSTLGVGPTTYEILGGTVGELASVGIGAANCLATGLDAPSWTDLRPDPAPGEAYYMLVRTVGACGAGTLGPGRDLADGIVCP